MAIGAAHEATLGLADTMTPERTLEAATQQHLANTSRGACKITTGYLLHKPLYEFVFESRRRSHLLKLSRPTVIFWSRGAICSYPERCYILTLGCIIQRGRLSHRRKAMAVVILLLGILQIAGGVFVGLNATSPVHQIIGAVAIGFGLITFSLAIIIERINVLIKSNKD